MSNITIIAPFRSNAPQVELFKKDINQLDYPADQLRVHCITGDNVDETLSHLMYWAYDDKRVKAIEFNTGRQKYPSSVSQERFFHLAEVFNKCLGSINWEWSDYSLMIPGDCSFQPDLVSALVEAEKDVISPFFWMGDHPNGFRFYDIWGFQKDGRRFPPYSYAWYLANMPLTPFQCDTVGGAMLCSKSVIEAGCHYTPEAVDRGLCEMAKDKGFEIWAHPGVYIVHR